jgi:hypothetical protein
MRLTGYFKSVSSTSEIQSGIVLISGCISVCKQFSSQKNPTDTLEFYRRIDFLIMVIYSTYAACDRRLFKFVSKVDDERIDMLADLTDKRSNLFERRIVCVSVALSNRMTDVVFFLHIVFMWL